jgi:hypothetical protein
MSKSNRKQGGSMAEFRQWATRTCGGAGVVELFGHQTIAGLVSEQEIAGTAHVGTSPVARCFTATAGYVACWRPFSELRGVSLQLVAPQTHYITVLSRFQLSNLYKGAYQW